LMREMSETAHPTHCHITEDFDWGVVPDVSKALWSVRCQKLHIRHAVASQKTLSWRYYCTAANIKTCHNFMYWILCSKSLLVIHCEYCCCCMVWKGTRPLNMMHYYWRMESLVLQY